VDCGFPGRGGETKIEKDFIHDNPIRYETETLETEKVNELLNLCRKHGILLTDYLVAEMMRKERTDRVVIAVDIREQITCYHKGSLGNYATATMIKNTSKSNSIIQKAGNVPFATLPWKKSSHEQIRTDNRSCNRQYLCHCKVFGRLLEGGVFSNHRQRLFRVYVGWGSGDRIAKSIG
jgi:hypothetical protein